MNSFTLDETINSRAAWGLRITAPPVIPPTKRIVESINVDGREGTLTILKGWEDISFKMRAALLGTNIQGRFREILPVILSAKTIYFSNDPAVYLKIKHISAGGLERKLSALYDFQLSFVCDPFYYIRNVAPITMTAAGSVTNLGNVFALPILKVYGTGSQTLTISGKETKLNILAGHLIVDSALMECYQGGTAQNNQMQGPFPVFNTGNTTISWSGGITKIEIEPKWRYL
jgi:phage-related protein